jgi:endonuclease YncB( thermonuclease family)
MVSRLPLVATIAIRPPPPPAQKDTTPAAFGLSRRSFGVGLATMIAVQTQPTPADATTTLVEVATDTSRSVSDTALPSSFSPPDNLVDASLDVDAVWTQFSTANDVPADYFKKHRYLYGFCERVIDGDTIRIRHVPGFGLGVRSTPAPLQQRGIAKDTLSIRIYGVDSPETGKNKRQTSQPYGDEATELTTGLVYHQMVKVTLLRRDQYGRAVAVVETVPRGILGRLRGPKDVSMELSTAGLVELYTGGGAEYADKRSELEAAIVKAQRAKRGMWSLENRQSAADFKKQQKQQVSLQPRGGAATSTNKTASKGKVLLAAQTGTHKARRPSHNKENTRFDNAMEAVVTGLEFVG